jgi:hypothetical protein
MSTLEVNTINPQSGTTITIGGSGDTVTLGSGATQSGFGGVNTPAFEAKMSGNQSVSNNADTKVQFNTENFDTDGYYDHSTNYRFTPLVSGKYFIYASVYLDSGTNSQFENGDVSIRLNGSTVKQELKVMANSYIKGMSISTYKILDLNGTSDYVEVYARCFDNVGNPTFLAGTYPIFGGYKIIE